VSASPSTALLLVLAVAGCGGEAGAKRVAAAAALPAAPRPSTVDACGLLTSEEIRGVTGATVTETKPESYGATAVCNYHAAGMLMPAVSLTVTPGMPKVANSAEMAAWRGKRGTTWGDIKLIIEPIEGLGVPAIRNQMEDVPMVTVEAAAKDRLLDVTTSRLEHSKALATKAMARLP
jgi:hypothetical protein